jgi:hypothetical protein
MNHLAGTQSSIIFCKQQGSLPNLPWKQRRRTQFIVVVTKMAFDGDKPVAEFVHQAMSVAFLPAIAIDAVFDRSVRSIIFLGIMSDTCHLSRSRASRE